MTSDLEQLVRDTLRDRANGIERGPVWSGARAPRHRRWPVVAAAVLAAAVAGGGLLGWYRADQPTRKPPSAAAHTCPATLPAAWRVVEHTGATVAGHPASPRLVTGDGDVVIQWQAADKTWHAGLVSRDGTMTDLLGLPRGVLFTGWAAGGDTVLLGAPDRPASGNRLAPTRSILAINTSTGQRRQLLPDPVVPAGYSVVDGVGVLDGVVYFGASPRAELDGVGGVVIAYDLAARTSRIVGRTAGAVFVNQDARGVYWAGGGVLVDRAPTSLPQFGRRYYAIAGDGTAWAWSAVPPRADPDHVVHWVGANGRTRNFSVRLTDDPAVTPMVEAVAGPFVVLSPYTGGPGAAPAADPQLSLLDTRTGAVAELAVQVVDASVADHGVLAIADSSDAMVRVDTTHLPGLHC